ncbi:ABC transporter substrate-binding protein [Pararhodospirillum photometricum]|nr:ABC transporter substrate-binding protein [Pararhodospirillum photometricum]
MKVTLRRLALVALVGVSALSGVAHADQLEDIRKAGVLRTAVFDANPPFGAIDEKTRELVGYDIDFAKAFADKLGVKLELVPTNPANRIPLLQSGKVDLIVADITITPERAQVIDFSTPYFVSGQQVVVPVEGAASVDALASARIGAVKGTTGEQQIKVRLPQAKPVSYDDLPLAFAALRAGSVDAITQDNTILVGLLAGAPDKDKYKILPELLSREEIGIGVRKGEPALLAFVNATLVEVEANGRAAAIFDQWFGSKTSVPRARDFTIVAPK